jgi:hypothetical protein
MKTKFRFLLIMCALSILFVMTNSYSSTLTATCEQIKGQRVDYFLDNPLDKPNKKFLESNDSISGSKLLISYDTSANNALFSLGESGTGKLHTVSLVKLYSSDQQITFVGILDDAPIMVTLYPLSHTVLYNMQSNWGNIATGIRSNLFHAICEISNK